MKIINIPLEQFLVDHLKLWKDLKVPAPLNELQSIVAWKNFLIDHTKEETVEAMVMRMLILQEAAVAIHNAEAADELGIYENRAKKDLPA